MQRIRSFLIAAGLIVVPNFVFGAVTINEVLFNPIGADTGREEIELYNAGAAPADMSGWELYPDGVGYFVFPDGFTLAPGAFVLIHLRQEGASTTEHLFHPTATANMGNSSGSVALFRSSVHSSATLEDFMRYHKPGSVSRTTWESAAVDAGLWTAGTFADIAAAPEGASVGLAADGVRGGATAWRTYRPLTALAPAHLWIGLKNSDDSGTRFDIRADVLQGTNTVASGEVRCIEGVHRNPDRARAVQIPFGPIADGIGGPARDRLAIAFWARIGTNPDGTKCHGHGSASGLRFYYDALDRMAAFGASLLGEVLQDRFLHSDGEPCRHRPDPNARRSFLDGLAPASENAKCRDSDGVKFKGGNPWREIGTWSMPTP